jgi:DNA polymerase-3 subunit epsilon
MAMIGRWQRWLHGARTTRAPASDERWIVVDTETTGLDLHRDHLLAIGGVAVRAEGIVPLDSFEIVVRNDFVSDGANVLVHGIGHAAQRAGVAPDEALGAYRAWAGNAPAVGFHADFDRAMLAKAAAQAGLPEDRRRWLDLAPLAAMLAPQAVGDANELDAWLAAYAIECPIRHNAAADAVATAELLLRLRALAARQGVRGYASLARMARERRWLGPH